MRKQKNIYRFGFFITTLFLCSYFLFYMFDKNGLFVKQWFTFAILFLSIYLYYKAYLLKSDSSFYFANVWSISFVFGLITYFGNFTIKQIWPFYILIGAIPYIINYIIYKNRYNLKMFNLYFFVFLVACIVNFLLIL